MPSNGWYKNNHLRSADNLQETMKKENHPTRTPAQHSACRASPTAREAGQATGPCAAGHSELRGQAASPGEVLLRLLPRKANNRDFKIS